MRPKITDEPEDVTNGCSIGEWRYLSLQAWKDVRPNAERSGYVFHRAFAFSHRSRSQRRLIPAAVETVRQIRDVQRWSADIQAGDDAQDANRLVHGAQASWRQAGSRTSMVVPV